MMNRSPRSPRCKRCGARMRFVCWKTFPVRGYRRPVFDCSCGVDRIGKRRAMARHWWHLSPKEVI